VIDLNQFVRNSDGDLGALKKRLPKNFIELMVVQRIEGVRSDIVMPDRYAI
jgi:carboxyl-terminal processing protease